MGNLRTASELITFVKELEARSAQIYKDLAKRYKQWNDLFLSFVKENEKHVAEVERAYFGVITDAIEGGFAFNLDPEQYKLGVEPLKCESLAESLNHVIEMERKMQSCYSDAAEQSKLLMADVPQVFALIAKRREKRIRKLELLPERRKGG